MLQSPVSPESPDVKHGARAFPRMHNYEPGLEVAENQNREKNDRDPVVVVHSPVDVDSHGRWAEAPQPIDSTSPQAMGDAALEADRGTTGRTASDAAKAEKGSTLGGSEKGVAKRRCGLGGKAFLLVILLATLLAAAVIGGAVGGTQAKSKPSPAPVTTSNTTQPPTTTAPPTGDNPTASEPTGPHVRFRLQTHDDYAYRGTMQVFEDAGLFRPQWPILSYTWTPARSGDLSDTSLLRCSVAFCANQTVLGWWGVSVRKQPGDPGGNHSTNFIHIACDEMNLNPECRGLGEEGAGRWAATKDDYSQVPITVTATGTGTGEGRMESTTEATATSAVKSKGSERATSRSGAETSSASRSRR